MEDHGLRSGQITQVRGFAAQNLRDKEHPDDAFNRRMSVIVRYQNAVNLDPRWLFQRLNRSASPVPRMAS